MNSSDVKPRVTHHQDTVQVYYAEIPDWYTVIPNDQLYKLVSSRYIVAQLACGCPIQSIDETTEFINANKASYRIAAATIATAKAARGEHV